MITSHAAELDRSKHQGARRDAGIGRPCEAPTPKVGQNSTGAFTSFRNLVSNEKKQISRNALPEQMTRNEFVNHPVLWQNVMCEWRYGPNHRAIMQRGIVACKRALD